MLKCCIFFVQYEQIRRILMKYIVILFLFFSFFSTASMVKRGIDNDNLTSNEKIFREAQLLKEIYQINTKNRKRQIYIAVGQVEIDYNETRFINFNERDMEKINKIIPDYHQVKIEDSLTSREKNKLKKIIKKHLNQSARLSNWFKIYREDYYRMIQES